MVVMSQNAWLSISLPTAQDVLSIAGRPDSLKWKFLSYPRTKTANNFRLLFTLGFLMKTTKALGSHIHTAIHRWTIPTISFLSFISLNKSEAKKFDARSLWHLQQCTHSVGHVNNIILSGPVSRDNPNKHVDALNYRHFSLFTHLIKTDWFLICLRPSNIIW